LRHDGNVKANDKLCAVTLSNGNKVSFKCCVSGTVMKWNQRLSVADDGQNESGGNNECEGPKDPNLMDPLLDGYLFLLRGAFPLKGS
jgi:hypothetical protein